MSDGNWEFCGQLGPRSEILFQGATVYRGQLDGFTHPAMYRYEGGTKWTCIGRNPHGMTQVHKLQVYDGRLYDGTWPHGKVLRYEANNQWTDCGPLGIATDPYQISEVNDLTVYNGKLHAGVIPKKEIYRYEADAKRWVALRYGGGYARQHWRVHRMGEGDVVDGPGCQSRGIFGRRMAQRWAATLANHGCRPGDIGCRHVHGRSETQMMIFLSLRVD